MGKEDIAQPFGPETAETARYDVRWLGKLGLDKKYPTLIVLMGADAGLRIPLTKDMLTLGRTVDADLVFHDEQISRRHAMISRDPAADNYAIKDLGSTNGTFVNDRPVAESPLKDGDKIFIGSTILKFVLEDEVECESGELVDRLMFQDDLTGLMVKRRFFNDLKIRMQTASTQAKVLSILMMDLDGLKQVNDTYGHPVGAHVIAEAGRLIGQICKEKENGQACRYGGDEFIAYLLNAPKEEAMRVAELLRQAIKGFSFTKEQVTLQLTISIGVATFPDDGKSLEAVTKAADEALYRAKGKGRDVVSS